MTTLALMGKPEGEQHVSNGDQTDVNQSVAKAFDTLAKAIQPTSGDTKEVNIKMVKMKTKYHFQMGLSPVFLDLNHLQTHIFRLT